VLREFAGKFPVGEFGGEKSYFSYVLYDIRFLECPPWIPRKEGPFSSKGEGFERQGDL
jgi:hypothetical protein